MTKQAIRLFEDFLRVDASPGRHSESTYAFLNRSARNTAAVVRALLESWFATYPEPDKIELKARFLSDFHAAFIELFLFAYFTRDGYHVTPHPVVPDSSRSPDFLVERDRCRFYLEATVAKDAPDESVGQRSVEALLLDAINDTPSPNFFLHLREFHVVKGAQPAARKVRAFLLRELPKFDPDSIDLSTMSQPLEEGPSLEYRDETITLTIGLIPRSPAARGRPDIRPIGIYPSKSRWGGSDPLLLDAIKSKATRYGSLDLPYVIAVNCISKWGLDGDDILDALFGTEQATFVAGAQIPIMSRKPNGAFMGPTGPWNTRVSAVLTGTIYPWTIARGGLVLYINPWAAKSLSNCHLRFRQAIVVDGRLDWSGTSDFLEYFGLAPGWPDDPAA